MSDSTTQFDFSAYLSKRDANRYEITSLKGGLVNLTVRAKKIEVLPIDEREDRDTVGINIPEQRRFERQETLILNYALPFVAAVGEEAPFSQFRQVKTRAQRRGILCSSSFSDLDCRGTSLASAPEILAAQSATRTTIPRVLFIDDVNHILAITDLGTDLLTLDQWLVPSFACIHDQNSARRCYEGCWNACWALVSNCSRSGRFTR
jgi:hypothetical protein